MRSVPWIAITLASTLAAQAVDFDRDVQPILARHCYSCHGPDAARRKADLRLDRPSARAHVGDDGPLIGAGGRATSALWHRVASDDPEVRMPPKKGLPLAPAQRETLGRWLDAGAAWPEHWAFTPPIPPTVPADDGDGWARTPIDRFVLAGLRARGLAPQPEADRRTLLRRVSLDLIGLPPTPDELGAFVADPRPDAFERQVDRLLASPRYGEHQAVAWLDLARYADTNGYEKDKPREIWPWRDWVIDAFNRDLPYDRFSREQLAGDLLPDATLAQRVATGFHRNSLLNDEGGVDAEEFRVAAVKDRVDVTARVWLGLTVDCAQCHDHKYDPITQAEYYRLVAFFDHTDDVGVGSAPLVDVPDATRLDEVKALDPEIERVRANLARVTPQLAAAREAWLASAREAVGATGEQLSAWRAVGPFPLREGGADAAMVERAAPELDPAAASYGEGDATRAWRPLDPGTNGTVCEVASGPGLSYVALDVRLTTRATLLLGVGSAGPLAVSVGGQEAYRVRLEREAKPEQDRVKVSLPAGVSTILCKLVHPTGPARFAGAILEGLEDRGLLAAVRATPAARTPAQDALLWSHFRGVAPELAALRARLARLQARRLAIPMHPTMVMVERTEPRATQLLVRGDFRRRQGPRLTPDTPALLPPFPAASPRTRLGLADWLFLPDNPLPARVAVNRLWASVFERPLVATPADFGTQGERPSHAALLDWLALEFRALGFSQKALLRLLVTSAAYRQASTCDGEVRAQDPDNALCTRGPRRRLTFEQLRDQALFVAGLLDARVGGPSVMPPQPAGVWENSFGFYDLPLRWKDADGPDRHRRGVYTFLRRTAPYPQHILFDGTNREVCTVQRPPTNTPLQALVLLNDPVFVEAAAAFAQRTRAEGPPGEWAPGAGVAHMFLAATGRAPTAREQAALEALHAQARAHFDASPAATTALLTAARGAHVGGAALAALTVVANAILNLDEVITRD